jgi:hypothetical protein
MYTHIYKDSYEDLYFVSINWLPPSTLAFTSNLRFLSFCICVCIVCKHPQHLIGKEQLKEVNWIRWMVDKMGW